MDDLDETRKRLTDALAAKSDQDVVVHAGDLERVLAALVEIDEKRTQIAKIVMLDRDAISKYAVGSYEHAAARGMTFIAIRVAKILRLTD